MFVFGNVQLTEWLVVFIDVTNQDSLLVDRKRKERLVVVFSLGSSPTVDAENREK